MRSHIADERAEIGYTLVGDYYLPDITVQAEEEKLIGIWGERRRRYLKEHHRVLYYNLLTSGKLNAHLADVDKQAEEMYSQLVKQLAEKENVTEKQKAANAMAWVQRMNSIKNRATEIVNTEIIYA